MTALQPGDITANQGDNHLGPGEASADPAAYVRQALDDYDERFLACDDELRRQLVAGTRRLLAESLTDEIRARLPVDHRIRAFCIRHDLIDELARLIADEAAGRHAGAVVVGGRVYALYPYLRGVPRRDADITAEVGVDHHLAGVSWTADALRIRGRAAIERVAARDQHVEIVLRERATRAELRIDAEPCGDSRPGAGGGEFTAMVAPAGLPPGQWDVHVSVQALGLVRQAPFGSVKDPGLDGSLPDRPEATVYVTGDGHLAIAVPGRAHRLARAWWRRLTHRGATRPATPDVSR
ncbi:MAG TPA: hypothetical protein VFU43_01350 [Streptosporangiaceae bacterium]|nr:hypothetical protein [Streptosporangiaceae bacterium]